MITTSTFGTARDRLDKVAETLLIPLAIRAIETQRPDALLQDERAVTLIRELNCDVSQLLAKIEDYSQVAVLLRNRELDRWTREFLARFPAAVVVHIGCGLDERFERVDNGQVEWYDLDLPEVIDLRRQLIGGEAGRYHLLGCSVLDSAWLDAVSAHHNMPFLFLAEGVFMYLEDVQVKSLVQTLAERFPGAELIFDALSPFFVWANNLRVAKTGVGAEAHWGLKRGRDLEQWGDDITLLDEWFPFRCREPRLGRARSVRWIPPLTKVMGLYHYRLAEAK